MADRHGLESTMRKTYADIIRDSFVLYRGHFSTLLGIYAIPAAPFMLLTTYPKLERSIPFMLAGQVGVILGGAVAIAATVVATAEVLRDGHPRIFQTLHSVLDRRLLKLLATDYFLATLLTGLGFLFCIVPGLFVITWLALVPVVVMLEDEWWISALARSKALGEGFHRRTFSCIVGMGILLGAVVGGPFLIFVAGGGDETNPPLILELYGVFAGVLTGPLPTILVVLLYFDLRARKELDQAATPGQDSHASSD